MTLARVGLVAGLWAAAVSAQPAPALTLGGHLQTDARVARGGASTFLVRRARLRVEASLPAGVGARALVDVAGSRVEVLDAVAGLDLGRGLALRVGKQKAPVGLERLLPAADLPLPERAFPTLLVPNRDVGVLLRVAAGRQTLEAALTNGVADGGSADLDADEAKDAAGRLVVRPFAQGLGRGLALGVAATAGAARGTPADPLLPRYQRPGLEALVRPAEGAVADGPRRRLVPQVSWSAGPVGVLAEAARSRQDVRAGASTGALRVGAWQATATVALTGERAADGLAPRRPLGVPGGRGAVALTARLHRLDVDAASFPVALDPAGSVRRATAGALGATWAPTAALRVQVAAERTAFVEAPVGPRRPAEVVVTSRLQVVY